MMDLQAFAMSHLSKILWVIAVILRLNYVKYTLKEGIKVHKHVILIFLIKIDNTWGDKLPSP